MAKLSLLQVLSDTALVLVALMCVAWFFIGTKSILIPILALTIFSVLSAVAWQLRHGAEK